MNVCFSVLNFSTAASKLSPIIPICFLSSCVKSNVTPDKDRAAYYNTQLGLAYLEKGNIVRAKEKLFLAEQFSPESATVNAALGYFFEKTDDILQAEKYYKNALHYSHGDGAQLNNYGAFLC